MVNRLPLKGDPYEGFRSFRAFLKNRKLKVHLCILKYHRADSLKLYRWPPR
jgi:hypothetical protein